MARVLIISSFVAASRVGGGAQVLALARLGIEPILVPTVLLGRHPGHGAPGGGPVPPEIFAGVLDGIEAHGALAGLDAVLAGHFSTPEQVAIATDCVMRVKSAAPAARIIVDPIMGDEDKGLYVDQAVAEAIAVSLVPCADIVAPNAWELARLTGLPVSGLKEALAAAHALGRPTLVSSVRVGDELGVVFAQGPQAWIARHARVPAAPRGTGDLLAAVFAAGLIQLGNPLEALAVAVGATAEAVRIAAGAEELPLAALPTSLAPAAGVTVEALDG